MSETQVIVTIKDWQKFNPRKDVSHSSWFRFEHSFFEDHELFELSPVEKLVWIYLLCLASKKSNACVTISYQHAQRFASLKQADVDSAIFKLEKFQLVTTQTSRARNVHVTSNPAHVTSTCSTNERTYERTNEYDRLTSVELEQIYLKYPRKEGKQRGMQIVKREVKNKDDLNLLELAVEKYSKHCKDQRLEPKYIKQFSSFMSTWRDWTDPKAGKVEFQKPKPVASPIQQVIDNDPRPDDPHARAVAAEKVRDLVKNAFTKTMS